MTIEDLRRWRNAEPFVPFRIVPTDGHAVDVTEATRHRFQRVRDHVHRLGTPSGLDYDRPITHRRRSSQSRRRRPLDLP